MEEFILKGKVTRVLPKGEFKVALEENGVEVHCRPSGKMRKYYIKMVEGDQVLVRMTPYDLTKGVITQRGWEERRRAE